MDKERRDSVKPPAGLPSEAVGFIALRVLPGRGGRIALYRSTGEASNTFAHDESLTNIAGILAEHGLRADISSGTGADFWPVYEA